jgi:DNA-binding transcriptional MerR regulator
MDTTFQIAEVAQRSGFTPATLRCYEDIGLLAPASRTDTGYRVYDETSLERLRFIARAKQLGCSLDEIAELTTAWDGGRCAPVQQRLRSAVEAKIGHAHNQIAELTTLAADLQSAAATLSATPIDGPCDDTCGRTTDTTASASPRATAVPLIAKTDATSANPDTTPGEVPIACTLAAGEMSSPSTNGTPCSRTWSTAMASTTAYDSSSNPVPMSPRSPGSRPPSRHAAGSSTSL